MSRSNGLAKNGGRKVVNEAELLTVIQQTLVERNLDEKLVEFDQESYADVRALSDYMSTEVAAIIGPHGGAMMNHRWAAPNTLVIEFLPTNFLNYAQWEEASLLNQNYAAVVVEPAHGTDMVIDPEDVTRLLTENLGKVRRESIRDVYSWEAE
jgi:capsular polysaccharide biosynthesis protein